MKKIALSKDAWALVDDDDYEWLILHLWHLDRHGYAQRKQKREIGNTTVRMHREIVNAPPGMDVDHADRNPLNNQKSNLRICSRSQNKQNQRIYRNNTSGFKGVSLHKQTGKWQASIGERGRYVYLGLFLSAEEAAIAYNAEAKERHGEFALLNKVGGIQ